MKLVFDSDALIKLTRSGAKEAVVQAFELWIPPAVEREAIDQGLRGGFADAVVLDANRKAGRFKVGRVTTWPANAAALPEGGEREAYALARLLDREGPVSLVTDDQRVIRRLQMLDAPVLTPGAVLVALARRGAHPAARVLQWLDHLRPLITADEYTVTRDAITAGMEGNGRGGSADSATGKSDRTD